MRGILHIRLLGEFSLVYDERTITRVDSPRLQSLLAYLLLNRYAPQSRQYLAFQLWPDSSESQARSNLRSLLLRLRRALPDADTFIKSHGHQVTWQPDSPFTLDVAQFEEALAVPDTAADPEERQTAARRVLALYTGDLLPACYDDWIIPIRERLREAFLTYLRRQAEQAERARRYEAAYECYFRLAEANPLGEAAVRGLMRSLAGLGHFTEALAAYRRLAGYLREELDVLPADETQALAARLEEESALQQAAWQEKRRDRPPFVGRVTERARLLACLDQAAKGQGNMAVVLGEAGMGKSRLLLELEEAAGWRGWQVAWGRGQEFTLAGAYAPLAEALTQALPKARIQQLVHLVEPFWLATAAPILPALQTYVDTPLPALTGEESLLPAAVAHLWRGLQQLSPHLFILDDVQWAGPGLWQLLDQLRRPLAEMSILVLVSGRWPELKEQASAWTCLDQWDRAGVPLIHLKGLDSAELAALADAGGNARLDVAQQERLLALSGGNPLLALSLLAESDLDNLPVTVTLFEQMTRRLASTSTGAHHALQAAAVIGYHFDYGLWQEVVEAAPARLPLLAGELERAGLIYLEEEGYRFAHDTLRAHVYTAIAGGERQQLHSQALASLLRSRPGDTLGLLHHAAEAGDGPAIARFALQAGQEALATFAYQAAVDYFSQASAHLAPADWSGRYAALLGRQQAHDVLAQRSAQAADVALLAEAAAHLDERRQAEAAACQARYCLVVGDYDEVETAAKEGLVKARRSGDQRQQATLLQMLAQARRSQGDYAAARQLAAEARELFRQIGSRHGEATITDFLGGLAWRVGDYQAAARRHATAAEMFRGLDDLFKEAMALNNLGTAYWSLGDYPRARATHQRALAVNSSLGHRRGKADNLDNLGGVAWVMGDYDTAVDYYNQALALRREMGDRWGVSLSLGNLGSAYRLQGKLEEAISSYEAAQRLAAEIGRRAGEGYARHGQGLALLENGRLAEAGEALRAAYTIRVELGERHNLAETVGALALLSVAEGAETQAQTCVNEMLALLDATGTARPALRQWVHYVAYTVLQARNQVETAVDHIAQAEAAMHEIANLVTGEEAHRFFRAVPLNRRVLEAVAAHAQVVPARLVRAGTPPGRRLTAADYTEISWTISTPADRKLADPALRRRHVLRRLLAEAEAQAAAPTGDDLASVLGVSRRTILRDMKALA
jgi:DNA-binding SARP family transcriptional activator/tetratricopeptide (TPR) repeat protein